MRRLIVIWIVSPQTSCWPLEGASQHTITEPDYSSLFILSLRHLCCFLWGVITTKALKAKLHSYSICQVLLKEKRKLFLYLKSRWCSQCLCALLRCSLTGSPQEGHDMKICRLWKCTPRTLYHHHCKLHCRCVHVLVVHVPQKISIITRLVNLWWWLHDHMMREQVNCCCVFDDLKGGRWMITSQLWTSSLHMIICFCHVFIHLPVVPGFHPEIKQKYCTDDTVTFTCLSIIYVNDFSRSKTWKVKFFVNWVATNELGDTNCSFFWICSPYILHHAWL